MEERIQNDNDDEECQMMMDKDDENMLVSLSKTSKHHSETLHLLNLQNRKEGKQMSYDYIVMMLVAMTLLFGIYIVVKVRKCRNVKKKYARLPLIN